MLPLMLSDGLNDLPGVSCLAPDGAFYVFPNVKGTGISSRELADYLLYEAGVAKPISKRRCAAQRWL